MFESPVSRLEKDRTKTDQDRIFDGLIKTVTAVRSSVHHQSKTRQKPVLPGLNRFFHSVSLQASTFNPCRTHIHRHTYVHFFHHGKKNTITNSKNIPYYTANTKIHYSIMPITTRTIAKGVPPRVHEPKGKAKDIVSPSAHFRYSLCFISCESFQLYLVMVSNATQVVMISFLVVLDRPKPRQLASLDRFGVLRF